MRFDVGKLNAAAAEYFGVPDVGAFGASGSGQGSGAGQGTGHGPGSGLGWNRR